MAATKQIRIGSWNIKMFGSHKPDITHAAHIILSLKADIVVVQEFLRGDPSEDDNIADTLVEDLVKALNDLTDQEDCEWDFHISDEATSKETPLIFYNTDIVQVFQSKSAYILAPEDCPGDYIPFKWVCKLNGPKAPLPQVYFDVLSLHFHPKQSSIRLQEFEAVFAHMLSESSKRNSDCSLVVAIGDTNVTGDIDTDRKRKKEIKGLEGLLKEDMHKAITAAHLFTKKTTPTDRPYDNAFFISCNNKHGVDSLYVQNSFRVRKGFLTILKAFPQLVKSFWSEKGEKLALTCERVALSRSGSISAASEDEVDQIIRKIAKTTVTRAVHRAVVGIDKANKAVSEVAQTVSLNVVGVLKPGTRSKLVANQARNLVLDASTSLRSSVNKYHELFPPNIAALDKRINPYFLSDHFPIVVEVSFKLPPTSKPSKKEEKKPPMTKK